METPKAKRQPLKALKGTPGIMVKKVAFKMEQWLKDCKRTTAKVTTVPDELDHVKPPQSPYDDDAPFTMKEVDFVEGITVVDRLLGQGSLGFVIAGIENKTGTEVALKCVNVGRNAFERAFIVREVKFSRQSKGPHTINIMNAFEIADTGFVVLQLERLPLILSDLSKLISERSIALPHLTGIEICRQIVKGVAEVHARGVTHAHLKPGNIGIGSDALVKIFDNGLASNQLCTTLFSKSSLSGVPYATPIFMSPEAASYHGKPGMKSDVWSLIAIINELFEKSVHLTPFREDPELLIQSLIVFRQPARHIFLQADPQLAALSTACFNADPSVRPTPQEMLDFDFFKSNPVNNPKALLLDLLKRFAIVQGKTNAKKASDDVDVKAFIANVFAVPYEEKINNDINEEEALAVTDSARGGRHDKSAVPKK